MRQQLDTERWCEHFMETASQMTDTGESLRVEECWNLLKNNLLALRDKYIPISTVSNIPSWREKGSFPIDKETRVAIRQKI